MNKSLSTVLLLASLTLLLAGCVTTSVRGFTDNNYKEFKIKKIAVRAPNVGFAFGEIMENSMIKNLRSSKVQAESFLSLFPPTRDWTNEEVAKQLMKDGYDSIMYVYLVGSDSSSQTISYINSGNAYAYGGMGTYSGTTVPVSAISRSTQTRVKIFDIHTADVIWIGDSSTKAGGLLFMGDETQTDSISSQIVSSLKSNGHI
jgi:hypothetical protein